MPCHRLQRLVSRFWRELVEVEVQWQIQLAAYNTFFRYCTVNRNQQQWNERGYWWLGGSRKDVIGVGLLHYFHHTLSTSAQSQGAAAHRNEG